MIPKVPARVIHTSIRVPVTAEEYSAIKRAAKLRGAPSLAAWLRERGACFGLADGIEGLAVAEDCKDAIRAMLEAETANELARDKVMQFSGSPEAEAAAVAYVAARDAYHAARAVAKEVAK